MCYNVQEISVLTEEKIVNKLFFAVLALTFASQAHADNLKLPVGDCLLSVPERQWCGIFTVNKNRSMKYVGGPCSNGQVKIKYRAKSIKLKGSTITMDSKYHFTVTWISPLGMKANISYRYADEQGEHTGQRTLTCVG